MSEEERNKAAVRRMLDVFNTGDLSVIDEVADPSLVSHNPHPGTENDRDGLKHQIMFLRQAFPDARFREEEIIAEGDKVFLRWSMLSTHEGPYMGKQGTGKQVVHHGQEFFRLQDGKIIEHHGEESNLEFLQKLDS
jgi:predicted ester cyclase